MDGSSRDLAVLAARARRRLPAIVDDLMERQHREVPEFFVTDDPAYERAVQQSTQENTELMLAAVRAPATLPRALGPGSRLEADVAVHHGAARDALLRTYRLGQQALVEHLIDVADAQSGALRAATRAVYGYMEVVMPLVAREYADEQTRLGADPSLRRLRAVQAALAGDASVDLGGYPLGTGTHVAVVATGPRADEELTALARALGSPYLVLRLADGRTWAWLAGAAADEVRARLAGAGAHAGPAGLGGPQHGAAGFRRAHEHARLALRVAEARGGVADLRTAALEALALGDAQVAREVVRAELGALTDARLTQTLDAWFAERERLAATAARLGVAPRTVTYRLRRAEDVLGCAITDRRAELQAALRLRRLFDAEPPG